MLRNSRSKNSPRQTCIVEKIPEAPEDKYILIRKLHDSLRPKLYQALADELLLAPQCTTTKHHEDKPIRPQRKAAIQAKTKMSWINKVTIKKQPPLHGWNERDQCEEDTGFVPIFAYSTDTDSSFNSTNQSNGLSSYQDYPTSDFPTSSEDELTWDSTPSQYELTRSTSPPDTTWTSTPFTQNVPPTNMPPPFPRDRAVAYSTPSLSRRNAFRRQNPNIAFSETPRSDDNPLLLAPKKSRIPLPLVPSQVVLTQVNDVTSALSAIQDPRYSQLRRSTRHVKQPDRLGIDVSSQNQATREEEDDEDKEKDRNLPLV